MNYQKLLKSLILVINIDVNQIIYTYGYIGFLIVSFIGTSTVVFPVPYLLALYYAGASQQFNPFIVAVSSGLGATLGEIWLYFVGRGGRKVLPKKLLEKSRKLTFLVEKYGPWVVFIFAATPLPDDIIYPLLGVLKMEVKDIFLAAFLGKTLLSAIVFYAGQYSYQIIIELLGAYGESTDIYASIILLAISFILMIIVLLIDWERILK